MFKTKTLLSSLLIGLLAISCTDEGFEKNNQAEDSVRDITNSEIIEFNYKGIKYSSEYYYKGDSIIILDEKTRNIHNIITTSDSSFILIDDDNTTTYYDNEAEYEALQKLKPQLRATSLRAYLTITVRLYKHYNNLTTPSTSFLINVKRNPFGLSNSNIVSIPDLGVYDHNNNISLAKISVSLSGMKENKYIRISAGLWLYDLVNYNGDDFTSADYRTGFASLVWNGKYNMKSGEEISSYEEWVKVKALDGNGKSFNDKASSLKVIVSSFDEHGKISSNLTSSSGGRTDNSGRTSNR